MNECDWLRIIAEELKNGSGGGFPIPPGGNPVVGIQEVDNYQVGLTAGTTTVPAGALSISLATSSDFAGTVQGAAVSGTKSISRTAQPGNVCPAFVVTRSSGTYDIYVVTPV